MSKNHCKGKTKIERGGKVRYGAHMAVAVSGGAAAMLVFICLRKLKYNLPVEMPYARDAVTVGRTAAVVEVVKIIYLR